MRTLKEDFFDNLGIGEETQIRDWLDKYGIKKYTLNDDLTIDVNGGVNLMGYPEEKLPDYIQFGTVTKNFMLTESNVTSLRGCPIKVECSFWCYDCKNLESLEGCPQEVVKSFDCSHCSKLESLKGCPKKLGKHFNCCVCRNLTSLKGCPQRVGGDFICDMCGGKFTEDDVKKLCKVKKDIIV